MSDDYAGAFDETINKPVDESRIPADTMKVIRDDVEDGARPLSFWNVVFVLKRQGLTVDQITALLEKYPNGIAKKYRGRLRYEVDRTHYRIKLEQGDNDSPPPVLPSYFIEELEKLPVEPVEWLVKDFIPANTVTGFFGDGGTGKDRTLMLLAAAVACDGKRWLGKEVKHGRALYYNVEDDNKELNRRRAAIAEHLNIETFTKFPERLKIVPLVGKETVLAVFEREAGMVKSTPLFESVRREIAALKPTLVIVGNRVNIFSVDQNSDTQARQCLALLFGLCTDFPGTTVIMPGHVSHEGMRSGRGDSGTVQWSNGCRARLLLDRVTKGSGEPDQDARVLQVKKANWGPDKNEIKLRWSNGLFVPDTDIRPEKTWSPGEVAALLNDQDEFLRMLDILKGAPLSPWPTAHNNAPSVFAADSRCKLSGKDVRNRLKTAMERLLTKGVIEIVEVGPPSKSSTRIRRVERGVVVNFPAPSPPETSAQPQGGEAGTVASVPFMLTAAHKRALQRLGYSDEQIREITPQEARDILAQGRRPSAHDCKLNGVLAAWCITIGVNQHHTAEQAIAAADSAVADDDGCKFKHALMAVAPKDNGVDGVDRARLEEWLHSINGVEVNHLALRSDGTDEKDAPQWTLELRVEPDSGSDAD